VNFTQLRKSVGQRVQLVPAAISLGEHGSIECHDDVWLIDRVEDNLIHISLPRTGHVTSLGKDHVHQYTSNPEESLRTGVTHAFLTLTVQLYLRGPRITITPTSRPGEAVFPKLDNQLLPQPIGALHAPIPAMLDLPYVRARQMLVSAGWQPFRQHWSAADRPEMRAGNGATFWLMGFHEISQVSPTGYAHCTFHFRDVYRNELVVVTAGEEDLEHGHHATVWNWFFAEKADA